MTINVKVTGQKMRIPADIGLVSGSKGFVKFHFDFSEDWTELEKSVKFSQCNKKYEVELDEDNNIDFPSELVAGKCKMAITGISGEEIIATANPVTLVIEQA